MSVNRGSSILIQTCFFFKNAVCWNKHRTNCLQMLENNYCWKAFKELCKKHPSHFLHDIFYSYCVKKKKNTWNLESSTVCCPVSGHLKRKLNFWGALFRYRWTKYFERKLNISALRWRFCRVESLQNSRKRPCSVQVNKHFMANIYAVYCAVKLVLLGKG